jgi:hypothetical protein
MRSVVECRAGSPEALPSDVAAFVRILLPADTMALFKGWAKSKLPGAQTIT